MRPGFVFGFGLLGLLLAVSSARQATAGPAAQRPRLPPPRNPRRGGSAPADAPGEAPAGPADEQARLAASLQSLDPAQDDKNAETLDRAGLTRAAALLRQHAADLRKPSHPVPPLTNAPEAAQARDGGISAGPVKEACPVPLQGDKLVLSPGCRYRARIVLSGLQTLGGEEQIAAYFEGLGFRGVRVYMRAGALPQDWPQSQRSTEAPNTGSAVRFIEGTWGGAVTTMARPPQVAAIWVAS